VNVSKTKLEGLFADELAKRQPTPGYMRLLKESVLHTWKARKAAVPKRGVMDQTRVNSNQIALWLRRIEQLRAAGKLAYLA